jgi:hypothetical protein
VLLFTMQSHLSIERLVRESCWDLMDHRTSSTVAQRLARQISGLLLYMPMLNPTSTSCVRAGRSLAVPAPCAEQAQQTALLQRQQQQQAAPAAGPAALRTAISSSSSGSRHRQHAQKAACLTPLGVAMLLLQQQQLVAGRRCHRVLLLPLALQQQRLMP